MLLPAFKVGPSAACPKSVDISRSVDVQDNSVTFTNLNAGGPEKDSGIQTATAD